MLMLIVFRLVLVPTLIILRTITLCQNSRSLEVFSSKNSRFRVCSSRGGDEPSKRNTETANAEPPVHSATEQGFTFSGKQRNQKSCKGHPFTYDVLLNLIDS